MAIEYVDATQLDSNLASVANAIRERSLGSNLLSFPSGFISELESIPGLVKKTYKFTKSSSGRTAYITNELAPEIPQVILVKANMDDFPANPTSGTIMLGCETIGGPNDSSDGYDNYFAYTTHYGGDGAVNMRLCYSGGYQPGISNDKNTIRVAVRDYAGSTFLAGVEYTVNLYYFDTNATPSGGADIDPFIDRSISEISNSAITTVGPYAFAYCSSLTTASFPAAISIGSAAFSGCSMLTEVNCPSATSIGGYAFNGCSSIRSANFPDATYIGFYAFASCHALSEISFPSVTTIGSGAFSYCSKLTTAYFPAVSSAGTNIFGYCSSLTTASFPSLSSIAAGTFSFCTSLSIVSFPSATFIGSGAFWRCDALTTAYFPAVKDIASAFCHCYSLTTASFPALTSIGASAFYSCRELSTISFPSVTTIGSCAFSYCGALASVYFPAAKSIGSYAFCFCSSLTTASFPSLSSIAAGAFSKCYHLLSVYLLGSSYCTLANINAFGSTPISTYTTSTGGVYGSIFVRASMYSSYIKRTNWATYSARFASLTDAEIAALGT